VLTTVRPQCLFLEAGGLVLSLGHLISDGELIEQRRYEVLGSLEIFLTSLVRPWQERNGL